jgi:hypothetical protein
MASLLGGDVFLLEWINFYMIKKLNQDELLNGQRLQLYKL